LPAKYSKNIAMRDENRCVHEQTIKPPPDVEGSDSKSISSSYETLVARVKQNEREHSIQHVHKLLTIVLILAEHRQINNSLKDILIILLESQRTLNPKPSWQLMSTKLKKLKEKLTIEKNRRKAQYTAGYSRDELQFHNRYQCETCES
jgi:uncharacterized protein YwgA